MNDSPSPFDTAGDEPVEARIVAWVLGESSAFEAAELERLCDERPELLVFRRRMRSLHGLLTEAEATQHDESWKLPPEKRRILDEIFGEEKIAHLQPDKELRIRRTGRRAIQAIAACLILTVFISIFFSAGSGNIQKARRNMAAMHSESRQSSANDPVITGVVFNKAVRDQEDKVEDIPNSYRESAAKEGTDILGGSSFPLKQPAAPAGKAEATYKLDTVARNSDRQAGAKEEAKRAKLGKQQQTTRSRLAAAAPESAPELEAPAAMDELPALARSGIGDPSADGFSSSTKFGLQPNEAETRPSASSPAPIMAPATKNSVASNGERSFAGRDSISRSTAANGTGGDSDDKQVADVSSATARPAASLELAGGSESASDDKPESHRSPVSGTSVDGIPADASQLAQGVTNGLRSGDQAINRNSIDAILNNPNRAADRGKKAKGTKTESDAKPPVLADHDSDTSNDPASQPTAGGGSGKEASELAAGKAGVAQAVELRKAGKDSEPRALPIQHEQNVDEVLRNLHTAEGNFSLGKYDDSKKGYEDVLKTDPYNTAARRGLDRVAGAKSDYYRAAYDHTRAELLSQVDNAWELKVPADGAPKTDGSSISQFFSEYQPPADGNKLEFEGSINKRVSLAGQVSRDMGAAADPFIEDDISIVMGVEMTMAKPAQQMNKEGSSVRDLMEAASMPTEKQIDERITQIRKQLSEPSLNNSRKQSLFGDLKDIEWLKKLAAGRRLGEDVEPPSSTLEARLLTDLIEEIPASENPYSTFSLNISDASFQLAKTALAKGERPDPESIKPEQFYNAVDYGDPAPSSNEPVAATIEQSAHPVIPGRNLVRVALRTGSAGRSAAQPLRLTLLVDQSGSMVREDRRASMEHALAQLGGLLTKADQVTVVGFSRTPHLLAEAMTGDQAGKLGDLINQTASEGGTNLEEAMKLGAEKAVSHQLAGAQNRIVLFTDGAANLGEANPERLAQQVKSLRQKGIAFDIAGIGADGLNDRLLSELARNGNGRYYVVGNENNDSFARQLAGAFRPAAENVKVQVNFNPQRVGKYKLIGFEKDRLKTEDFRNDAVDAAELAADEAGVAIYQVEPLTEGSGELGEVSVRFRDAASGQMVERAWTIPYAAQATAFDRATPSMQLAGLSLLAAEKLKGGPLADAIDFKQLTGPSAFVKQFYGSSPRVADMLQVIEKLK